MKAIRRRGLARRLRPDQSRCDEGFTLIELLIVVVILPLLLAGLAEVIITVLDNTSQSDPKGTAVRLADSHDSQITSAYFVRDVQSASSVSAASTPLCAPVGAGHYQLLGLEWTTGTSTTVDVSYFVQQSPLQLVRYFCSNGSVVSTSVVSSQVFGGLTAPVTPTNSCVPSGASSCVAITTSGITTTYVAVTTTCSNDGNAINCAATGKTAVLPTQTGAGCSTSPVPSACIGVPKVSLMVMDNVTTNYSYSLAGVPRVWSFTAGGQSNPPPPLNPPLLANGTLSLSNCRLDVSGTTAVNSTSSSAVTGQNNSTLNSSTLYITPPGSDTNDKGTVPSPVVQGPPVTSPYDSISEAQLAGFANKPDGVYSGNNGYKANNNTYTVYVESGKDWDPSTLGSPIPSAIYVLKKGLGGSATGPANGALFYVAGGDVSLGGNNGNFTVKPLLPNWESPVQPSPEIVLWMSRSDAGNITLDGNGSAVTIQGGVYAPTATATINGAGKTGGVSAGSMDIGSFSCSGGGQQPWDATFGSPQSSGTNVSPSPSSVTLGSTFTATATVQGQGTQTPTGTVTFAACGPESAAANGCNSTDPTYRVIGTQNLTGAAGVASATSPAFGSALTQGGIYCISATFNGDLNYQTSADASKDGCVVVNPAATISFPVAGTCYYALNSSGSCSTVWPAASTITGTASDTGGPGIKGVSVTIQNPAGQYWNGTIFAAVPASVPATSANGYATWSVPFTVANLTLGGTGSYTVTAVASDKTAPTAKTGTSTPLVFSWNG